MNIHVILRMCGKPESTNGLPRPFNLTKEQVVAACFKSLIKSFGDMPFAITIIADAITESTKKMVIENLPPRFDVFNINVNESLPRTDVPFLKLDVPYNNNYLRLLEFNQLGNLNSMKKCYEVADTIQDDNTWIFFLEEDYLFDYNNFLPRLMDFTVWAEKYRFALPIFIHATDYPDQYTRLLSRCYIFQTTNGYWREVSSTTWTFICQSKTYRQFASFFKSCEDDGTLSTIFKKKALCLSPMPGFATHCHEGVMSNFINWASFVK